MWDKYIIWRKERSLRARDLKAGRFVVEEVYPDSPAAAAGIRKGMLFIPRNRYHFEETNLKEKYLHRKQQLIFLDPENGTHITIFSHGFLYGIKLRRSVKALCDDLSHFGFWSDDLFAHIHDGDEEALKQFVHYLQNPRWQGLFSFISYSLNLVKSNPNEMDDVAVNFIASIFLSIRYLILQMTRLFRKPMDFREDFLNLIPALYHAEKGDLDNARQALEKFESEGAMYASTISSLYYYTQSIIVELEGQGDEEIDNWLSHAYEAAPSSKLIQKRINARGGEISEVEEDDIEPYPFPLSYVLLEWDPLLPKPEKVRLVSMNAALSKLKDDQFLILISLSSYRANGYYSTAMFSIGVMYPLLGDHFPRLHVVTGYEQGDRHHSDWMEGEEYAFRQGAPIQVLYDPDYLLPDLLGSTASPRGVIISRQGDVIYSGSFQDEKCFWKAMSYIKQPGRGDEPSEQMIA